MNAVFDGTILFQKVVYKPAILLCAVFSAGLILPYPEAYEAFSGVNFDLFVDI